MASIVMNVNGCDTEHDSLMLKEYGEEVMCAGWNPQLALVGKDSVEQIGKHPDERVLVAAPDVADSAPEEVIDSVRFLRSGIIPQCP
jgi:hypothetical protein